MEFIKCACLSHTDIKLYRLHHKECRMVCQSLHKQELGTLMVAFMCLPACPQRSEAQVYTNISNLEVAYILFSLYRTYTYIYSRIVSNNCVQHVCASVRFYIKFSIF
jgi:hypothetical protein